MKQIILTLAAVAASVTAVSGQGTGVLDRYYIDGLIYEKTSETTVSCAGAFDDGVEKVVIPETINANGSVFTVIGISDYAFSKCNTMSSITIPKTITFISSNAFSNDTIVGSELRSDNISVDISDLTAWCKIDFEDNYANPLVRDGSKLYVNGILITDLEIPNGVTVIKSYAFYGCSCLTSLTLPSSVTTIGSGAFYGCSCLTSLTLPSSVTTIGSGAFYGCFGLTSLEIPNSVTTIGGSAFYKCSGLTSIRIPDSVVEIGDHAFRQCRLEAVVIGRNVTTIGMGAFLLNPVRRVDIYAINPPAVDTSNIFMPLFSDGIYETAVLSVPTGSLEAYRTADVWKEFKNIQEKDFGGVDGVEDDDVSVTAKGGNIEIGGADNTQVEVYNLSGQLVYSGTDTTVGGLAHGIYIVRVAGQTFKVAL